MHRALLSSVALFASLTLAHAAIAAPLALPATASVDASASVLVEQDDDGLSIDWSHYVLRIKGVGMAPERGTLSQRRSMAKRTAFADGTHRLSEALDALRVNGEAYVRDLTAVDDATRSGINNLVREAQPKDVHYWADGSVELTFEIPLKGPTGLARVVLGKYADATSLVSVKEKPSGLIVDARGTGAQPALCIRLRDAGGKAITPDDLPIAYFHQLDGLKSQVGDSPLRLKAHRAFGPTHADLLLTDDEANRVKAALHNGNKLPLAIIL